MIDDRFKFRVWDKEEECYQETDADFCAIRFNGELNCDFWGDGGSYPACHISNEDAIIEQCTGLRDKKGNLIYEGDFLIGHDMWGNQYIYTVEWYQGKMVLRESPDKAPILVWDSISYEIAGNIHTCGLEDVE